MTSLRAAGLPLIDSLMVYCAVYSSVAVVFLHTLGRKPMCTGPPSPFRSSVMVQIAARPRRLISESGLSKKTWLCDTVGNIYPASGTFLSSVNPERKKPS